MNPEEEKEFFSNLEFSYSRTKEDVWASLDQKLDRKDTETTKPQARVIPMKRIWLSVAAAVALILTSGLFARFYTTSVSVSAGEFTSHTLPDGSEVHLNAETTLSYNPYWWRFERKVAMEGEAYFVVAKGERFSVISNQGSTEVLGTEFNVYARGEVYEVYCKTGKVKVSNASASASEQITPGESARVSKSAVLKLRKAGQEEEVLSWRSGRFVYNNTPLTKVFEDLERHYAIEINLASKSIGKITHTFTPERSSGAEAILQSLGLAKNLNIEQQEPGVFLISKQ